MSCRTAIHSGAGVGGYTAAEQAQLADAALEGEQRRTLKDLARAGDRPQFEDLAGCLGVPSDVTAALWTLHRGQGRR